ncbi:MAG: carboxypeptidase regulatory-like domain-containing protein [Chloroflexota bacterium]|nr:MAG: carboxypeptidase regulatory-like domain-containing protein [Chloroflexota bacterium]
MPTPTATLTPTITPSATATSTRTATPYPTYEPRVTPTLSWPTPGPSAFFTSRYVASTIDPTPIPRGAGALRGRVIDWRGIGLQGFRVQVHGDAAQADAVSSADGQYTISGIPPGPYEIALPDYRSEPARSIPILAGAVTTVDWIETGRGVSPLAESGTPTVIPNALVIPTPKQVLVERPPDSPARPSPPELAILKAVGFAIDRSGEAFTRGAIVVVVVATIVGTALWVRLRL